jgi:ectoine hydroxylase-related dioxygenase (phytanoyl-CoA dioxygenase family)
MSAVPSMLEPNPLKADGFVVVRNLIDRVTLRRMQRGFDRLLEISQTLPKTADVCNTQFIIGQDPFALHRAVWASGAASELQLGNDPRILRIACDVLETQTPVQIIQQAHYKLPGDGVAFKWHQDASNRRYGSELWKDLNGHGSFVQVAIAVDPMSADNGGLSFIPGSHRNGFIAHPDTGDLPDDVFDTSRAVTPELNPGDAVVFGPFVIHGSFANESDRPRRTFLQGFASPGANRREYPGCGTGVMREIR